MYTYAWFDKRGLIEEGFKSSLELRLRIELIR